MIFMENFYEPAHVGALKIVRQINKKIHTGSCILHFVVFIQHLDRIFYIFYTNFL